MPTNQPSSESSNSFAAGDESRVDSRESTVDTRAPGRNARSEGFRDSPQDTGQGYDPDAYDADSSPYEWVESDDDDDQGSELDFYDRGQQDAASMHHGPTAGTEANRDIRRTERPEGFRADAEAATETARSVPSAGMGIPPLPGPLFSPEESAQLEELAVTNPFQAQQIVAIRTQQRYDQVRAIEERQLAAIEDRELAALIRQHLSGMDVRYRGTLQAVEVARNLAFTQRLYEAAPAERARMLRAEADRLEGQAGSPNRRGAEGIEGIRAGAQRMAGERPNQDRARDLEMGQFVGWSGQQDVRHGPRPTPVTPPVSRMTPGGSVSPRAGARPLASVRGQDPHTGYNGLKSRFGIDPDALSEELGR